MKRRRTEREEFINRKRLRGTERERERERERGMTAKLRSRAILIFQLLQFAKQTN